ncbi:MAG TPA: hypothetical protein EYM65_05245 [Dehalococcoidia bacterium]|nr:hypothetical protein [Dehalococcoidia bacterium]
MKIDIVNIDIHIAGNLYCRFMPFLVPTPWSSGKQDLARGRIADRNRLGVWGQDWTGSYLETKKVSWLKKMDEAHGPARLQKSGAKYEA